MSDYYQYIFVREDLTHAQQIIQVSHAVNMAAIHRHGVPNTVLFGVANEAELIMVNRELKNELSVYVFNEPDGDMGFSALASMPLHRDDPYRELFRKYKMFGSPASELTT